MHEGRHTDRAVARARSLHGMRPAVMGFVAIVAGGQFIITAVWLSLVLGGNLEAARSWGLVMVFLNLAPTLVLVFLTWIVLEALGRIERETDRVQLFMDNVYRRMP